MKTKNVLLTVGIILCLLLINTASACTPSKIVNEYSGVCTAKYDLKQPQIKLDVDGVQVTCFVTIWQFQNVNIGDGYHYERVMYPDGRVIISMKAN